MANQRRIHLLDQVEEPKSSDTYTSKNGIVFKLRKVSPYIATDMQKKSKPPKPPIMMNDDKGREEENPNDPDYIEQLETYQYELSMNLMGVYLTLGSEVVELPKGIQLIEDTEWSDALKEFGLDIYDSGRMRYLQWLKYVALPDDEDQIMSLFHAIAGLSGAVTEVAVKNAEDSFPDNAEGNAPSPVLPEQEN